MSKKVVDTYEYVSVLRQLTEEGKEVSLPISGGSMVPFLVHDRDYIFFRKPNRKLKQGDMVFYQRWNGQFVMHRIYKVKAEGFYIVGDAQTEIEGPVFPKQIFAVVTKVKRKGRIIGPEDGCWKFFERVWIRIVPLRPMLVRLYTFFTRHGR